MAKGKNVSTIQKSKVDAESLIVDVLKKVPQDKKMEALRIVEGFAMGTSLDQRKAG